MITENIWGLPEAILPSKTESVLSEKRTSFCKLFNLASATILLLFGVFPDRNVQAGDNEVPLMDKVIVTASRLEEKIASVPANVTVISEQEIKNSPAETVPELLRSTPGIVVNDITGNGRNITVDLRGFGETASLNTLLLIDGRRINQADLSGVDWTLIPKDRIQQIELFTVGGEVFYTETMLPVGS